MTDPRAFTDTDQRLLTSSAAVSLRLRPTVERHFSELLLGLKEMKSRTAKPPHMRCNVLKKGIYEGRKRVHKGNRGQLSLSSYPEKNVPFMGLDANRYGIQDGFFSPMGVKFSVSENSKDPDKT